MSGPVPPLHLVLGDDEYLASRAVDDILAAVRATDPDCDVRRLEAAQLTPGGLPELFSPSLFAEGRAIVVRNAHEAGKDLAAALVGHARDPGDGVVLVVVHAGAARGKALADGIRAAGAIVVPAARITKHRERIGFIRDEVRRRGARCTEEVAAAILDAVGNDLRELASACDQLVSDTGGRLDADAVARYHRGRAEVSGFTVADAAMVGDAAAALEALRWALAVGVDPVPIADALADGVRTVARVSGAGRGNAYQLAGSLGLPPWKVERAQRQARGWTGPGLSAAMRAAAIVNADVKGGSDDRVYALERAVLAISAARSAR